jgi:S1-C subfamily serine protease
MLTTTAEFAVGSSGGPLFDDCGNVIGMVASTSSVYSGLDEASGAETTPDSSDGGNGMGNLQMILKMCVPPSDILKLVTGK